ncbi:sensor histidine kinase [Ohtaekwangia sp.]|uniref:sensor histidine kinase n=1 Tax=Ohtaekwangia sp. TaxID=2066019 RepID=UPI002FDD790B
MKPGVYRILIVTSLTALTGLLVLQVYWFVNAFAIQERQFDTNVNVALRSVADRLLKEGKEFSVRVEPVQKRESNTYFVSMNRQIEYNLLDSLIRAEFKKHDLFGAFTLAIYDHGNNALLWGNFYKQGALTEGDAACLGREHTTARTDFAVTFPGKRADIAGSLNLWIITAAVFLLVLIVFAYMVINLSKQKRLAEVKNDFINNMTHELQTPITNIAMASEVLKTAMLRDARKAQHYAGIIHEENQRLRFHVEQVLQTAQMERSGVHLQKKKIDIHQLIETVIHNFEMRLQARHGSINTNLLASQSSLVGDPFHLSNLLYNLLDNADKYSPAEPEITITTHDRESGILISVADKGAGMKHDVQRYIFDKFYRAATGNLHDVKGFGLGLTYVLQIAKAHNGSVTVDSAENRGSRFDVFLKYA